MKNLKFLLTLSISSLVLLTACSFNESNLDETHTNKKDNEIISEDVDKTKDIITNGLSDASKELLSIINDINETLEVGTAGSSLKAVRPTSGLMNWAIGTQLTNKQIKEIVDLKLESLEDEEKEEFLAQLGLIDATYKALLSDSRNDLLESSENTNKEELAWLDVLTEETTSLENIEHLMNAAGLR